VVGWKASEATESSILAGFAGSDMRFGIGKSFDQKVKNYGKPA
jgi:hypothetical protein